MALRALGANKLRTVLTMLGMIIGVGAVIALMAIGQGMQAGRARADRQPWAATCSSSRPGATRRRACAPQAGSAQTLTDEDAEAIGPERVPQVAAVAPEESTSGPGGGHGQNANTRVVGVTPDYLTVRNS